MTTTFLAPVPLRYSAFICYDPADDQLAEELHASLETYAIPSIFQKAKESGANVPARLYPIFLDKEELPLAAFEGPSSKHLKLGLKQSKHLLVVVTPKSVGSAEVEDQIRLFVKLGTDRRIVCALLDAPGGGKELADGDVSKLLPESLQELLDDPLQRQRLIILDERGRRPDRQELRLRIVAGLTGIDFETLRQRDYEGGMRRLKVTVTVVVTALIVFIAMGTEIYRQKQIADAARQNAIAERARTLQKRDQIIRQEQGTDKAQPTSPGR